MARQLLLMDKGNDDSFLSERGGIWPGKDDTVNRFMAKQTQMLIIKENPDH